jgi:hypothetical protein
VQAHRLAPNGAEEVKVATDTLEGVNRAKFVVHRSTTKILFDLFCVVGLFARKLMLQFNDRIRCDSNRV